MLKDFPYFHGIDGRSASIVMGENRWESPKYYYWKMQGKVVLEKSEALEWGKKHSQLIRDEFVLRSGLNVIEPDNVLFIHPDHDFIIAYVNYVVPDEGAVLITKTCSEFTKKYWDKGKVPDEAYIEAQHDMAVTGMNKVFIALLAGGNKYFQFEISWDEERIEQIILREKLFYDNCILAIDVPEFTGIGDEEKAVNGMFKCEDN